ncbi:MAG: radical SAM protein [Thermoguttaceae bacterium]
MKNTLFDNEFAEISPHDGMCESVGKTLLTRLDSKYAPAFARLSEDEQIRAAFYFLPHTSQKETLAVTRPRVIKWYCPFADQTIFPSGMRYSINTYIGCEHGCNYCYVQGYSATNLSDTTAKCKENFRKQLIKDLDDLEKYDVSCTPAHISNSTDAFGPIENEFQNSFFVLEKLLEYRHRFSTITLLTKNPSCLLQQKYLRLLLALCEIAKSHPHHNFFQNNDLSPLWLEVSLAFWNDQSRDILEHGAPSVSERLAAVSQLRKAGVPVALRIDPLFPRNPIRGKSMQDFGLMDFQSLDDLENTVRFCSENRIRKIIYSPLKITRPRVGKLPEIMRRIKIVYESLCDNQPLEFRGGSWRLPHDIAQIELVAPLLQLCNNSGIIVTSCKENLLATP